MGTIEDYLKSKEKKKYYCLSCFRYAKKKFYLQVLEDETGKAYQCPNCKYISINWVIERNFDKREQEMLEKMGIIKFRVSHSEIDEYNKI
ncbi:MAG: hypothetical protein V3V33_15055 [Candidatus Lokiarchaeia archaeon]